MKLALNRVWDYLVVALKWCLAPVSSNTLSTLDADYWPCLGADVSWFSGNIYANFQGQTSDRDREREEHSQVGPRGLTK